MTLVTLALMTPDAHACSWVEVDISTDEPRCADETHAHAEAPPASVILDDDDDGRQDELVLQYGMQFLPRSPAHHIAARANARSDAYLGAEIRYLPASEVLWAGRVGAGIDVLGKSDWDLTLGVWLGTAGVLDRAAEQPVVYKTPIAGTEIAFGIDTKHVFGKYRWLAGIGGGHIDEVLSENELTLGYKLLRQVHLYGQYLAFNPGEHDEDGKQRGVGLGVRVVL